MSVALLLQRVVRSGFVNFFRNGFVSTASVLVMTVTLFVMGGLMLLFFLLNASLALLKEKVDINVYFVPSASEEQALALKRELEQLPEVARVEYISREEALRRFILRHQGEELTLQAIEELGENPLGAVLAIKAKEPSQYAQVAQFLSQRQEALLSAEGAPIIERINYFQNKEAIDRLANIIDAAERFGVAATAVLVIATTMIIFTTIRLAIYGAREEIAVMRLVGASNAYIRGPFVFEGAFAGALAGLFAMLLLWPVAYFVGTRTKDFFGGVDLFAFYTAHAGVLLLVLVGTGVVLGGLASFLAVKRYLNV
ncbi:MAG: cell division protein FtsX [Candidatus Parcubacteria bacterium]|nr:MAG: cell division protein FtsX [Candidatus Parcubacteria bacterium]